MSAFCLLGSRVFPLKQRQRARFGSQYLGRALTGWFVLFLAPCRPLCSPCYRPFFALRRDLLA